ncbi:glutamyl-tRNA reductase [Solemya pervernicosa gill symbiont]|uniref:Glutamyl-tRNA reductase n=2 Tax=Gammaproteobacteria incertae sedis TaxID=118884 RepID=A0A1T2L0T1_9GAMM|nr:glutamyl-tRNA reductase [Candidatus Reidiella endopervernicosa]OOZ38620.1 glutamyl-tRNA reductase [Solemya pervernicosa gill symbiont]QKQ25996.1 glutamyl-tRNA reductase [Candidatus Reidiella endopervernicosa]
MSFVTLGINHRTAPVEIRERVTFAPEDLQRALTALNQQPGVAEAALLSTCNRTELYCRLDKQQSSDQIIDWLCEFHNLERSEIEPYVYLHPDIDAVQHMLRVASGLDSLILGEPQILGQIKTAYQHAVDAGTTGSLLERLFHHTFSVAKQVRTDTAIGSSPVSVAFAAVSLAKQIFGELNEQTVMLLGAGETIELAAQHLHENGIGRIIVANRTAERAHTLASQYDGYAIALDELPAHLAEADIVIASTASQEPILHKEPVKQALKQRKHRPIFMVDIAVPRDIDPSVAELNDVYLYTVDDLQEVIQENLKSRQEAAKQAEDIVEIQASHFMNWLRSLDTVSLIREYRGRAEACRDELMEKALSQLSKGKSNEDVMRWLANTLTNKLLHQPCAQIKQAGFEGRNDLIENARQLLDLPEAQEGES